MSTAIRDAIPDRASQPMSGNFRGRISRAPADLNEKVAVTLDAFTADLEFGPMRWQARDETSLPARGDRCIVSFDDTQEGWVTCWWPFDT